MPTRDDAWKLLCEYTQSESLRKHMLAVETCVRAYAKKNGADEETWGLAALLHDFDYERWPNNEHSADKEHPAEGAKILKEGMAQRASDIDIVWINGYGWPVYRGGPMFYADLIGPDKVLAKMNEFEATMGEDFKPAALLEKVVAEKKRFQDL